MSDPPPPVIQSDLAPPGRHRLRFGVVMALLACCFGCDRATKQVAVALLPEGRRMSLIGDCLRLEHVRNPGAFLSLGAGLPERMRFMVFTWGVAVLVLAALIAAFHCRASARTAAAAALVAGGGLGNLWDRVTTDALVTDFLNVGIGEVRTGIFNVADLAIVAGVLLLALRPRGTRTRPAAPGSGA